MHRSGLTLAFAATVLVAGCTGAPHNNVLLFGTDTKVALDISSAATQGGAPQITLGYRRSEAVWMPLVANKFDCPAGGKCTVTSDVTDNYILQGEDGDMKDSYSVFASFGAKFSGGASGTEAKASGGLAQFFATGIAAQKLAANPGIENALKVNNPGSARAEAEIVAAERERLAVATKRGIDARTTSTTIVECVSTGGSFDQTRLATLAADAKTADPSLDDGDLNFVAAAPSAASLRVRLFSLDDVRKAMQSAVATSAACT